MVLGHDEYIVFVVRSHQWFVSCCTHLQCGSCVEVDWLCVPYLAMHNGTDYIIRQIKCM